MERRSDETTPKSYMLWQSINFICKITGKIIFIVQAQQQQSLERN